MSDEQDDPGGAKSYPLEAFSDDDIAFLKDEGLEILHAYWGIQDERKRALVLELARAIAEAQPPLNGN